MEQAEPITASRAANLAGVSAKTIGNWREWGWFPEGSVQTVRTSARGVIYTYDPGAVVRVRAWRDRVDRERAALQVPPHGMTTRRVTRAYARPYQAESFSD